MVRSLKRDTSTHKALLVLLKSCVTLGEGRLALFIAALLLSESVAACCEEDPPQPSSSSLKSSYELRRSLRLKRGENLGKVPLLKGDLGGSLGVRGEVIGLALFIILLLSESVAATPTQFSSLFKATLSTHPRELLSKAGFAPLTPSPPIPSTLGGEEGEPESQSSPELGGSEGEKDLCVDCSLNKGGWGGSSSIAQQPAATSQDATRAADERAYQEGEQLLNQGTAESLRQAITKFEEALPLYQAVGDRRKEAATLNEIGYIYDKLGEKQKALDYYNQSLPLSRATGDTKGEAVTLNNIGGVYNALGEKQKALEYYNQSLPMFRATEDKAGEAVTLNNIGGVYDALGEKQKALEYYNQSLPLRQAAGNKAGEAATLNNIGGVYDVLGEKQKALEYYNQSLLLSRATGDKAGEAVTLNNIGLVYDDLGQTQKALSFYNQSLPLRRATGDKAGEVATLYNLAYLERDRGNLNEALTPIEAAITIIEDLRTKIDNQQLRTSYFATVQNYYQLYIDLLMQLHKTNPSKGYNALALNASEHARARSLLELLTEAHANIRQGADPKLLEQERTLQQQFDTLEQRRIQPLSTQYTNKKLAEIKQQQDSLNTQLEQVQEQIRRTSPRYASLKYPQPLTLSEIQQQVLDDNTLLLEYSLGEERSYLWAVTKTSISSYELPKRADIEALAQSFYENTGKQKPPERGGLGVAPREDSLDVTTKLSQILLSPVAGQLAGKRLLIVSDGALQYLPFAALPTPDSLGKDKTPVPLIVQHEIVNSPSASTIAIIRQDTNGRKLAPKRVAVIADPVFSKDDERVKTLMRQASRLSEGSGLSQGEGGNISRGEGGQDAHPTSLDSELSVLALTRSAQEVGISFQRLPFTRKEGDRILSLIPNTQSQSAFDFAANRATATSPQLSQYQIVHFATHGILNSQNPELSGVVLSLVDEKGTPQNGFLRLNDIFNLNLPAELVVLSACETGLGQDVKGEGLVGLTRGFMYAGSPRVLVSLWSVADEGTSELMSRFYKKMLQEKLQPAAALRAAQIEMLQTPQWQEPYYWAAFTLQGEWK